MIEQIIWRDNAGCWSSSSTRICEKVASTPKVISDVQFFMSMCFSWLDPIFWYFCYFSGLSSAQLSVIKNEYQASSFPGLDIPMNQVQRPWLSHVEILYMTNRQLEKCLHMVNIQKHLPCGEMWRKICHVEKYLYMVNVETNLFGHKLCCFVGKSVLFPFMQFSREIY